MHQDISHVTRACREAACYSFQHIPTRKYMGLLWPLRSTSNRGVSHQGAGKQRPYYGRVFVVLILLLRMTGRYCTSFTRTCYSCHQCPSIVGMPLACILAAHTPVSCPKFLLKCMCWSEWLFACNVTQIWRISERQEHEQTLVLVCGGRLV